jgi:CBS domain-containing protein
MGARPARAYNPFMRIRDAMDEDVEVVDRSASLYEAAYVMRCAGVDALPVVSGARLVGLLTARDIIERAVAEGLDAAALKVRDVMSHEVASCPADADAESAARLMDGLGVGELVVVENDGEVAGLLTRAALAAALAR